MRSDRELILSYKKGDDGAFEALYDRHSRSLYVYVLARVLRREVADDLVQETFLTLLRRIDQMDIRDDMRPFLFVTARHLAVDWLRREERRRAVMRRQQNDPLLRRKLERGFSAESEGVFLEDLNELLHRLPDAQREAVVLKDLAGMTFREAANLLDVPENTVVSRYRYGMDKLRSRARATALRLDGEGGDFE